MYERDYVRELLEVPLATERDWLALRDTERLEIVDGPTGDRVIELAGYYEAAAVSPDGERIAVLGHARVQVLDIASGTQIVDFEAIGDGVAWRQDGAVLFQGYTVPTHAVDPQTGTLLAELDLPIFRDVDRHEIDPSWRWIHADDGSIVRTLDFMRLELGPGWARTDSGVYDGDLNDLAKLDVMLRFRVGADPNVPPIYSAAELEPWLHRPGLVRAFFAGESIAAPTIPADALAKLHAKR